MGVRIWRIAFSAAAQGVQNRTWLRERCGRSGRNEHRAFLLQRAAVLYDAHDPRNRNARQVQRSQVTLVVAHIGQWGIIHAVIAPVQIDCSALPRRRGEERTHEVRMAYYLGEE